MYRYTALHLQLKSVELSWGHLVLPPPPAPLVHILQVLVRVLLGVRVLRRVLVRLVVLGRDTSWTVRDTLSCLPCGCGCARGCVCACGYARGRWRGLGRKSILLIILV